MSNYRFEHTDYSTKEEILERERIKNFERFNFGIMSALLILRDRKHKFKKQIREEAKDVEEFQS